MSMTADNPVRNGVDTAALFATIDAVKADTDMAKFRFRATNRWVSGTNNQSTIHGFYGAKQELAHEYVHVFDADHPTVLVGTDRGPSAPEYLLHALAACLTTTLVYSASARTVRLTEVSSTFEGDMDVRGCLGIDDAFRNGFTQIRATFQIKGDAPAEKLRAIVENAQKRSAVYDMVRNGVPISIQAIAE
jgi:uncharacterized OsmC-like protein